MAQDQYLTFQKFNDKALADELAELFNQNSISYQLDDSESFDPTFSNSELAKDYRVKIRKSDFENANNLLLKITARQLEEMDKDYYLFNFSDEELIEIVTKPDEWGQLDYLLAQKLLKQRGKEINPDLADTLRRQRIKDLAKPEESHKAWIYAGYAIALLGGFLAIFIGWHLLTHKKTLPNGDRVYGYSSSDRKHGNRIFILGIICFVIIVLFRIMNSSEGY